MPAYGQSAPQATISHLDYSARVQTISNTIDEQQRLSDILSQFYRLTGVPMICNTSLNDRGEPIINKHEEAFHFALKKGISIAYIDGLRIELKNHEKYKNEMLFQPEYNVELCEEEAEKAREEINPYHLSRDCISYYFYNEDFRKKYDITKKQDAKEVSRLVRLVIALKGRENIIFGDDTFIK